MRRSRAERIYPLGKLATMFALENVSTPPQPKKQNGAMATMIGIIPKSELLKWPWVEYHRRNTKFTLEKIEADLKKKRFWMLCHFCKDGAATEGETTNGDSNNSHDGLTL